MRTSIQTLLYRATQGQATGRRVRLPGLQHAGAGQHVLAAHPPAKLPMTLCMVAIVALAALPGCSRKQPPAGPQMVPQVMVTNPVPQVVVEWDEYPAWIEAVNTVEIKAKVSGHLQAVHFEDGKEVKTGDPLFTLDARPFEVELGRAAADKQRVVAALANARSELKRAEALRGTKAIAEEDYDRRANAVREFEAALQAAEAAEASAKLNLQYTRILAPIDGKLGRRQVAIGDLIPIGGDLPMVTLVSMDPVYACFDVDETTFQGYTGTNQAHNILGAACELTLGEERHPGKVDFYDNQVHRQTGTIRLRGVFANAARRLIPGQFGRVQFQIAQPKEQLTIPETALASDLARKVVYVVNAQSLIEMKPVTVGRKVGSAVSIAEGLKVDDRVVVSGLFFVRPGMPVQIGNAKGGPAGSPVRGEGGGGSSTPQEKPSPKKA